MNTDFTIKYILKDIQLPFKGGEIELNNAFIRNFYFIENIENVFLTGAMEFDDINGFFEKLPLTGEETLRVIIEQEIEDEKDQDNNRSYTKVIDFEFFKVKILEFDSNNGVIYKIDLIEKGALRFIDKQYSVSYVDQKVSYIIQDLCTHQLGLNATQFDIEETGDSLTNYLIPYWKPIVTIKDLVKRAREARSPNEGGFLFYSNTEEESPIKKFVSFSTLMKQKPDKAENEKYYFKRADINPFYIHNFKEARNPTHSNRSIIKDGISGKKYYWLDLVNDKKVNTTEQIYSQYIDRAKLLGNVSYLSLGLDDPNSEVKFLGYGDENQVKAFQDYRFRMSMESYNKREVVLNGMLDRYAGKVIYVEQMSDNEEEDAYVRADNGAWLIKAVTHNFFIDGYENRMTILKDGYDDTDVVGHDEI